MGYSRAPALCLPMLNLKIVKAIALDLDDTLWPVWPVIERAENVLKTWLKQHAPKTAALFANASVRDEIRSHIVRTQPELKHNLSAVRRETIRVALARSKEDPLLAEAAFDVFFAERNRVLLFDDAMLALTFLAARFPIVALSNGNADIRTIGIAPYFRASISAQQLGVGKPDVRIFQAAASAVSVDPVHMLHIGDDPELDVVGALNAGMQTVWLNRADDVWKHKGLPHMCVTSLTQLCAYIETEQCNMA